VVLAAGAAALAVRGSSDGGAPADRPAHLVDLAVGTIDDVTVREPATGRTGHLVRDGDHLVAAAGSPAVAADRVRTLEHDLAPLLAVRSFDHRRRDYGLDPPQLLATVTAGGRVVHLLVGSANFDRTAVYVGVGSRTALVLPRIGSTLREVVGQAEP
jgi:hypothetical protein